MTVYTLFPGISLLVIAIAGLVLGAALVIAPLLGVGARRQDPALASVLQQVADAPAEPLRETYIADIVDAPAAPLALARSAA